MSHARRFHKERSPRAEAAPGHYGMLVGSVRDGRFEGGRAPHFEIWIEAAGTDYRIAVNVQSVDGSEVLVHFDPHFTGPSGGVNIAALAAGAPGFTEIATGANGHGLDYLRDGLFDINDMEQVPDTGGTTAIANVLETQVDKARADSGAVAVVFGMYFRDGGDASRDSTFGFSPEQGLHDIHMMQGNAGSFARDNTTHGDGGLFLRYGDGTVAALFVRFATQGTETDDQGNPVAVDP